MVDAVSVNPSSSQYIAPTSGARGSIAAQSFYFGGNPNVASITGNRWLIAGAVVALVLYAYFRFRK